MTPHSTPLTPPTSPAGWSKARLLGLLFGVGTAALALLVGLLFAVWSTLTPHPTATPTSSTPPVGEGVQGEAYRDRVAAEQMLQVPAQAASTPSVSSQLAPTMPFPAATAIGPAGVGSGFPHTPEGAVAQLAAIEVSVVDTMSIPHAHQVHAAWSVPGGVQAGQWRMTRNVQSFLTAAGGQGDTKDDTMLVAATPAAGLVKGVDGPDWVLACVLLDVRASIVTDARTGYGHCERMTWTDHRWQIAPGTPPATAPSVWPGSDWAVQAGWHTFREVP